MPITVFHTPFKYRGLTKKLFLCATETVKGNDFSRVLYLGPTLAKIHDAQKIFHSIGGECYIPPIMTTIRQLSKRLFSVHDRRKVISPSVIAVILSKLADIGIGHACLIGTFINEMSQRYPSMTMEAIFGEVNSAFRRLGVPEEVWLRCADALKIMNRYRQILKKCNAADENVAMEVCPQIIRNTMPELQCVIVDGIVELTVAEESILKSLIDRATDAVIAMPQSTDIISFSGTFMDYINNNFIFNNVYLHAEKRRLHLQYLQYSSSEEEIEGIARSIKNHFIGGHFTDLEKVLVVLPDVHRYSAMVSRVFTKYGIPFTISSGKPLAMTKPFLDLLALLDSIADDYPRSSFSQFLSSPHFRALPTSLRQYIPALRISSHFTRGKAAWIDIARPHPSESHRIILSEKTTKTVGRDLAHVFAVLAPLESIRRKARFEQYSEALLRILQDLDFDSGSGDDRNRGNRVSEIVNNLSVVGNLLGSDTTDLRGFTEELRHCLLNTLSSVPDKPGVQIMSIVDTEGLEPEYVLMAGLRDGDFPSKPGIDYLLPDSVRKELGLVTVEKYLLRQKFIFRKLLSSAREYSLSYSAMDGDRLFLPSSFLSWKQKVTDTPRGIFSPEEDLIRNSEETPLKLPSEVEIQDKRMISRLFSEKTPIRVTDIDAYRTCPRRFFIERVLCLKPLDIATFELDALILGTIYHEIMQEILTDPLPNSEVFALNAARKIDTVLSRKRLDDYWAGVIRETFLLMLPRIYSIESSIAKEGYAIMGTEVPVEGEVLPGVTLKGKIDRLDRLKTPEQKRYLSASDVHSAHSSDQLGPSVVELIDYKTGATPFSGARILSEGASLQLILYAALIRSKGLLVDRVGIYSLKDLSLSWIPNRKDKKTGRTIDEYIAAARRFLTETVLQMRRGYFAASPLNDQTCRNCFEKPYCPYMQKTLTR